LVQHLFSIEASSSIHDPNTMLHMNTQTSSRPLLSQNILKLLSNKNGLQSDFTIINKSQFDGETLENFFAVLEELKESGQVVFKDDYKYVPYEKFGDFTSKQYAKLDIYLKLAN